MTGGQSDLTVPRERIDAIDRQILDLLQQRHEAVRQVIRTKIKTKLPIFVPDREEDKIGRFRDEAERLGLDPDWADEMLRMIMSGSRASQSSGQFPNAAQAAKTILIVGGAGGMGALYAEMFRRSGHGPRILDKDDWDRVGELAGDVDVAIVSVPIHATAGVIRELAPHLDKNVILADFTSNKNGLLDLMMEVHSGPVASLHPMHGPGVSNLSKQLLLVCRGRGDKQYQWLLEQFALWGMRLKDVDPNKHDHAMHMIQGLRHFVALLHGSFMRYYDLRPEDIVDFSSPIYRAELMMTVRMFAQNAEMYADIVFSDEERRELLHNFFEHHRRLSELVENDDKDAFIREFESVHRFFGDFAEKALEESGYLINRLTERFN